MEILRIRTHGDFQAPFMTWQTLPERRLEDQARLQDETGTFCMEG